VKEKTKTEPEKLHLRGSLDQQTEKRSGANGSKAKPSWSRGKSGSKRVVLGCSWPEAQNCSQTFSSGSGGCSSSSSRIMLQIYETT